MFFFLSTLYLIPFLYTHFQPSMYFLSLFFSLSISVWYCTFFHPTFFNFISWRAIFSFLHYLHIHLLRRLLFFSIFFYYPHLHLSRLLLSSLSFVHVRCYPSRSHNNLISSIPFIFTMLLYSSFPVSLILLFPSHPPAPPSHQSITDPSTSPSPP